MKPASAIVSFLALVALAACSTSTGGPDLDVQGLLSDSQFLALDAGSPSNRFDGRGGSLLLGEGWAAPDVVRAPSGQVSGSAWTVDGEAVLYFPGPLPEPLDFYARCYPFAYPGAPPQAIDFFLDSVFAGRADVAEGWQDLRAPLSGRAGTAGVHRLVLRFSRAKSPSQVSANPDRRILCVNFSKIAIIPRATGDAKAFLRAPSYDPKSNVLTVAEGGSAAIPVPADALLSLHLGAVEGCGQCTISADLVAGATRRKLLQSSAGRAGGARLAFDTKGIPMGRLILSVRDSLGRDAVDPSVRARIQLPGDFLRALKRFRKPITERPDLFVYLVDTLRADELQPYGSRRASSPQAARFARDAVVYENTWAASTWTLPSIVSILTGVYPIRHGVMQGDYRYVEKDFPSLAGLLGRGGYDTVGVSQSLLASHFYGVDAGFSDFFCEDRLGHPELDSQEVRAYLAAWLTRGADRRPIFGYVHTVDPHGPYTPRGIYERFARETPGKFPPASYDLAAFAAKGLAKDEAEVAHLRALYDGEVLYADQQFGNFLRMLKWLGRYDESVIVLVADHGEEFGEHGGVDHGRTVYEELLRVPLIVKYPRSKWGGLRVAPRVSTVDIFPTLLSFARVPSPPSGVDGRSLSPGDATVGASGSRAVFSEVNPVSEGACEGVNYRAFAVGRVKGIESATGLDRFCRVIPKWRVFDLDADRAERSPLAPADPRVNECRRALEDWLGSEERKPQYRESNRIRVEDEYIRKLRSLGYMK